MRRREEEYRASIDNALDDLLCRLYCKVPRMIPSPFDKGYLPKRARYSFDHRQRRFWQCALIARDQVSRKRFGPEPLYSYDVSYISVLYKFTPKNKRGYGFGNPFLNRPIGGKNFAEQ